MGLSQKKSQEGQDYDHDQEGGGIDLVKAKKVLKAEDKFDKELKKEQKKAKKRELKEAKNANDKRNIGAVKLADSNAATDSSDEESDNLDWLPDPDKYGKDETTTEKKEHKQQAKKSNVK